MIYAAILAVVLVVYPGIRVPLPNDSGIKQVFPEASLDNKEMLREIAACKPGGIIFPNPPVGNPGKIGEKFGKEVVPYALELSGDKLYYFSLFPIGHCNVPCYGTWRRNSNVSRDIILGIKDPEAIPALKRAMFSRIGGVVRGKLVRLGAEFDAAEVYKIWEEDHHCFTTMSPYGSCWGYSERPVTDFVSLISKLDDSGKAEALLRITELSICRSGEGCYLDYFKGRNLSVIPVIFENLAASRSPKALEILKRQYQILLKQSQWIIGEPFFTEEDVESGTAKRDYQHDAEYVYQFLKIHYKKAISQLERDCSKAN